MNDLLVVPFAICGLAAAGCWLASVITREYSWVDRLWSVLPAIYVWCFAWEAGFAPRSVLMALLATAWGARLTFNFWRKGGYAPGGEDYRWAVLRARMPGWAWAAFNIGFVAGYQNLLIFLFTLPAWQVAAHPEQSLGGVDVLAAALFVALLIGETVADQQQWTFQQDKRARLARNEPAEPFLQTGLFRWSRHPNFFFEMSQWWAFTLFPLAAGIGWLNPGIAGAVLLTLLFDGSTRFTEAISRSRYPSYAAYQKTTSRLVPWFPRAQAINDSTQACASPTRSNGTG